MASLASSCDAPAGRRASGLRIGLLGFGCFGQFLAGRLARQHDVCVSSVDAAVAGTAAELGCAWVPWARAASEMLSTFAVDVLVISTSIVSFQEVVSQLPMDLLRARRPLIVDVLSVKEFPREILLNSLPAECDVLCTHPMFGPVSGKGSWEGLRFVYDLVRASHRGRAEEFLGFFERAGCRMVAMTCAEHDRHAAATQFLTHFTGRVLGEQACEATPVDTMGYQSLCGVKDNVCRDSFDLFYGLFKYNSHSLAQLQRFKNAVEAVEMQLTSRAMEEKEAQVAEEGARSAGVRSTSKRALRKRTPPGKAAASLRLTKRRSRRGAATKKRRAGSRAEADAVSA